MLQDDDHYFAGVHTAGCKLRGITGSACAQAGISEGVVRLAGLQQAHCRALWRGGGMPQQAQ